MSVGDRNIAKYLVNDMMVAEFEIPLLMTSLKADQ